MLTSLSPEVNSNDLNNALAENNPMKAKRILCAMGKFSESECKETGKSSIISKVVDALIKKKMDNPDETITNSQVDNSKKGNTVLTNETTIILTQN